MNAAWIDHSDRLPIPGDHDPVGVDTEFMRRNTFYPQLALVQAAHAGEHWTLDPLAYDAGADLRALVSGRVVVMHSASEDLEALAPLLGDAPLELFDTQIAAALCGMGPGLSYQNLLAAVLGVHIPKDETRSDWLQRPLTPSQLDYAEQDVAHLEALHEKLSTGLHQRRRAAWHAEDCAKLVQRAQRDRTQPDLQPQRSFPGAAGWPVEAQVRLKRALLWRDQTARKLDRPRPWVLDDTHAVALSRQPPGDARQLFERAKGQRALRGPQRAELLALMQHPVTTEELAALQPIPPAPGGETKRAVDAMRAAVRTIAAGLDLPAGLLCPRRLIVEFAATRIWPAALQGWRAGVLQAELTPLLSA
ncbi:MAG: ribonuclease D [Rhodanobacteraceae bacterium]